MDKIVPCWHSWMETRGLGVSQDKVAAVTREKVRMLVAKKVLDASRRLLETLRTGHGGEKKTFFWFDVRVNAKTRGNARSYSRIYWTTPGSLSSKHGQLG